MHNPRPTRTKRKDRRSSIAGAPPQRLVLPLSVPDRSSTLRNDAAALAPAHCTDRAHLVRVHGRQREGICVVGVVEIRAVLGLLHGQHADGAGGVGLLNTRVLHEVLLDEALDRLILTALLQAAARGLADALVDSVRAHARGVRCGHMFARAAGNGRDGRVFGVFGVERDDRCANPHQRGWPDAPAVFHADATG